MFFNKAVMSVNNCGNVQVFGTEKGKVVPMIK
jgi:hypothetical protein